MQNYYDGVRTFASQSLPTPWQLDRFDVATKLLRVVDNPDHVYQSQFGCCGEVAFLRAWLLRNPTDVVRFATELFNTGRSTIGAYTVQADAGLLGSQYFRQHPGEAITSAVWMICGALADAEDDFVSKFTGTPDQGASLGTMASEVATWLGATGLYSSVDHNLCAFNKTTGEVLTVVTDLLLGIPLPNFSDAQTIDDALKLQPGDHLDVILAINANMLVQAVSSDPPDLSARAAQSSGIEQYFANHWIMLDRPIVDLGNNQVRLEIWTWGKKYSVVVTKDTFNNNYYGAIRAFAYGSRRTPVTAPIGPWSASDVDVWYGPKGTLEVAWTGIPYYTINAEWFEVFDNAASAPMARQWLKDSGGYRLSTPIPDSSNPYGHAYRVDACNFCVSCDQTAPARSASSVRTPLSRVETPHFRFNYCAYTSADQIRGGDSHAGVDVKSTAGRALGHGDPDGRMTITTATGTSPINIELNTPDYVARLAIALEYCYRALSNDPLALGNFHAAVRKIDVTVKRNPAAAHVDQATGDLHLEIDPQLSDADIPLAMLNLLLDTVDPKSTPLDLWSVPGRRVIQDAVLGTRLVAPLLAAYAAHPESGLQTQNGTAAAWAYRGALNATSSDPLGTSVVGDIWRSGNRDDLDDLIGPLSFCDDRYADFALALASPLLAALPTDPKFAFAGYQSSLPKPPVVSATITTAAPATFSAALANPGGLAYHLLTIGASVPNVAVTFQSSGKAAAVLQMLLLGTGDTFIDLIRTTRTDYTRTLGLRGGTVKKILFVVGNPATKAGTTLNYTLGAAAVMNACDLMITPADRVAGTEGIEGHCAGSPDLWLTSTKASIPTNEIDVKDPNDRSIVHVRVRNFGNQAGQARVKLTYSDAGAAGSAGKWSPLTLDSGQDFFTVTVPAPASGVACSVVDLTGQWQYPVTTKTPSLNVTHVPVAAELFAASADTSPDASLENNRAETIAITNDVTAPPGHIKVVWPTVQIPQTQPWRVIVEFDDVNVFEHGPELANAVRVIARRDSARPDRPAAGLTFDVNVAALLRMRQKAAGAWKQPARFPSRWAKRVDAQAGGLSLTMSIEVKGRRQPGISVTVPTKVMEPVPA